MNALIIILAIFSVLPLFFISFYQFKDITRHQAVYYITWLFIYSMYICITFLKWFELI